MDHIGTTLHINTQFLTRSWTIIKENVKKIMNKKSVKNRISVSRSIDNKDKDCDSVIRTTYGRIIQKPDRLAYRHTSLHIALVNNLCLTKYSLNSKKHM